MSNPTLTMSRPSYVSVCVAGLLALAIAMGIGRFAFTPMLPLMIRTGTLDVAAGGWLAAANYAGYLLGALTTARLPLTPQRVGLLSLAIIVLSTAAMGWSGSVAFWLALRFLAGAASAWALVSTSVWCLAWLARLDRPSGAGILYAGVGAGIALAGLYCWRAGAAGAPPESLWIQLGMLALAGLLIVATLMPRDATTTTAASRAGEGAALTGQVPWGLVLSYGILGFGYILPATFLPVLARAVVDDPSVFGAAWPVFGTAAAISTLLAAAVLGHVSRRRVLAGSHALMALGCLLPVIHLSVLTVLAAALLVGGTFMVATMAGMQEAKASTIGDPTSALGRMTAAFAIGQMAGPILSSALSGSAQGFGGLFVALAIGAVALLASAAWLLREPRSIA
ncbi:YbfB/YjiJ family MFS transporter [Variovorax sp. Sphag1AA]|uniref:YbfB/YjiJ family MFS transporter n=1 Tax=Variovorax sp. Sphag1AA TaxID=2587027 RepID=UPI00160A3DCC|nr:YbfB/YjiJ family MFS transporter [Variovorax sp. Sphag1AA]MBB3178970.1 putative MFS family arabinose efflux permease [Variovorax sp. Sphag1AA]